MGEIENEYLSREKIVISGISGIFPSSQNAQQFMENLYNKVDMVGSSESYWNFNHPDVPKYVGKAEGLENFDASFFKVTSGQGAALDSMGRKILEQAFCAIFDAGVNPSTLSGKKVGVFVGSSFADIITLNMYDLSIHSNHMVSGSSKSMLANRISYWLNLKGPSYSIDGSCCSSTTCLTIAYRSIRSGECDAAIVAGCNVCQHPILSLNMRRAGYLCADGKTKCFDKNGEGCARSEAISVLFLQKEKEAKRIYTEIYHANEKYFAKPDGMFLPTRNSDDIEKFLKEFYSEANVSPSEVEYIEANGAGLREADSEELEAIGSVFAKDTVMVGSVKSNMGNAECASGVCSITKICLAYNQGKISGNLHYSKPFNNIPAVQEGKLQVLSENTPFNRSFTAVNNFSYTGLNYHVLMKGHYKPKDYSKYASSIPRLVLVSGRSEPCVERITNLLKSCPVDPEQIALLQDVFKTPIIGHLARGYTLLDSNIEKETECLAESIAYFPEVRVPVWFLYSGMGSQWAGMGADLMRIPAFAGAIEKCQKILQPEGIDVVKIICDPDDATFDNILNCFIGITAVQIGLTDILNELGIIPDHIIGHSQGEQACAYADGSLTAEETILSAYYRGKVSLETKFVRGLMAAVKLGHDEVKAIAPPEIESACHNSSESTTISGPEDIVRSFVKDLTDRGIFAREVNSCNIAFHSKYIAQAGPTLLSDMNKIIKTPKLRSEKWISTSVPPEKWDSAATKYASGEYFTNNLLSHVYFEEASKMIQDNAIVIEIAPHGLLQAIVRKSLKNNIHVPLTKRADENLVKFFLQAIGKLYQSGLNPRVDALYPKVKYPVSTETPLLSHFIAWEHSERWEITRFNKKNSTRMAARSVILSIQDDEWKFLEGHLRNGQIIFLESALIVVVWETLAMYYDLNYENMPVTFEDLKFHQEIVLNTNEAIKLHITIQKGNNRFEVTSSDTLIVSGTVRKVNSRYTEWKSISDCDDQSTSYKKYTYNLLRKKYYYYKSDFQLIQAINTSGTKAKLKWAGNWITFLDSFIQLHILVRNHDGVSVPKLIRKLSINFKDHPIRRLDESYVINIDTKTFISTRGAGVNIKDVIFEDKPIEILKPHIISELIQVMGHANIQIAYIGFLQFDDLKLYNKISNGNEALAMDFSGFDKIGNRVMGIMANETKKNLEKRNLELLWQVPQNWSLEDAATVLLPYVQAYYCLIIRAKINDKRELFRSNGKRNINSFILNGDDAFGQAAISVCLELNCSVYTMVNSDHKKQLLMKTFPQLQDINIITATDEYFYITLAHNTNNELCELVINNTSGVIRECAMKCVAQSGFFLDLSEHDMKENLNFGMAYLTGEKSYIPVHLSYLLAEKKVADCKIIQNLVQGALNKGIIKPFQRTVYEAYNNGKTIIPAQLLGQKGRALIKINNVNTNKNNKLFVLTSRLNEVNEKKENLQSPDLEKVTNFENKTVLENGLHNIVHKYSENQKAAKGVEAFYSFIDDDEWAATNPVVIMPTLLTKISSQMEGEINPNDTFLIMVPGFEGHSQVFKILSERLKIQALTMQMGPDMLEDSVEDIAKNMLSHINRTFNLKSKFYILGYSFGAIVALKLAALIEEEGHTGVVYCLDSSPDVLKMQIDACLGNVTNDKLQIDILKRMYKLMSQRNPDKLDKYLDNVEGWSEKIEVCIKELKKHVTYSHDYIRAILSSTFKKILLGKSYACDIKLNSEIVVIKGIAHPKVGKLSDDYNLSKYTNKKVKIFDLLSEHASVPKDCSIANIVNTMLDPKLIEDFNKRNLCDMY